MSGRNGHAVVLGASAGGMAAAAALATRFARVTVLERDRLEGAEARKGVPQGRHVHGFYSTGIEALDALVPGFVDALRARGAVETDLAAGIRWWHWGGFRSRAPIGMTARFISRPALDLALRERLTATGAVTFRDDTEVLGLATDAGRARVQGVRVRGRATGAGETIDAELVVDATGRGSRTPQWLEELGYAPPARTELRVDVGYATRVLRRKGGELGAAQALIVSPAAPRERRLGVLFPIEDGRWTASLAGWLGDHPPTDEAGWLDYARTLPTSAFYDAVKDAEPLSEVIPYRFVSNLRRHYERLARLPAGLLVTGDALASFNPAYGQGTSVAALEGAALKQCLAAGDADLARRYHRAAATVVDRAWTLAAGEDFRFPQVEGARPPGTALVNDYVARAHRASQRDRDVHRALFTAMELSTHPATLMAPHLAWRVMLHGS